MKGAFITYLVCWLPTCLIAESSLAIDSWERAAGRASHSLQRRDYKIATEQYQRALELAPMEEQGHLKSELALSYYLDQNHEQALRTFLEALDAAHAQAPTSLTEEEQELYQEALVLYLEGSEEDPLGTARLIRWRYGQEVRLHDDFYLLNYLVAVSYANLGQYDQFFGRFFDSYQRYPDSFLAHKTRGVLELKLMERIAEPKERAALRHSALNHLQHAASCNPNDTSLFRIIFGAANRDEAEAAVASLKIMLANSIIPLRSEIIACVQAAVACKEYELAQSVVDVAHSHYGYSRSIDAAQQFLKEHRD